jgi:hypothetical protein
MKQHRKANTVFRMTPPAFEKENMNIVALDFCMDNHREEESQGESGTGEEKRNEMRVEGDTVCQSILSDIELFQYLKDLSRWIAGSQVNIVPGAGMIIVQPLCISYCIL